MSKREWWPGDAVPKRRRPVAVTLLGGATVLVPEHGGLVGSLGSWTVVRDRLNYLVLGFCDEAPHAR